MRRKLLIGATLAVAVLAAWTLAEIAAPRTCPATEHRPSPAKPGICRRCGGRTPMLQGMCKRCADRTGCSEDCGETLQSGLGTLASRLFGGR